MKTNERPIQNPMKAIELVQVSKHYGSLQAVDNLSLEVVTGEIVALLGPNGAGKTTTLSMMMGLCSPTQGRIEVFGQDPRSASARQRIGAMLQESDVPGMLQVQELLELFSSFYSTALDIPSLLNLANLTDQAKKMAHQLSGGQKRRLMFALSMVGNPDLIFLDEPTVAMDVQSRNAFWEAIRGFQSMGKTIVLTTHHLEEADALSDRIVVIDQGRVLAQGTPTEIKTRVGGSKVRFRSEGLTLPTLESLPKVGRADIQNGVAQFYSAEPELALKALFSIDVPIHDLEVSHASLEEAFLSITAKV